MASSAKKRAIGWGENPDEETEDSSDENPEDDDDETEEEEINEQVDLHLEGHNICSNDYDGIKKLLQQLFLKAHVNTAELTDIIIQQNHIGTVVKQAEAPDDSDKDDPDEVFGFITILNLTERKDVQCLEEVKELILDQCEKNSVHSVTEQLEQILNDADKPVGLVLSERFVNVPPQTALPMFKHLLQEMSDAQKTNKPSGKCHYCLMISKTCKEASKNVPARGGAPQEEFMFINAEEEFFYEKATIKFHYSVQDEADTCLSGKWSYDDVPMKPFRTVMLVPADRLPAIMDQFKEYLSL